MPFETAPPKYARVLSELQKRISEGTYVPGSLLPSEDQLTKEFGVSRTTVIRAVQILKQEGWVDSQQGTGRFVRGRPASAEQRARPGRLALEASEGSDVRLVEVGHIIAPDPVAAVLNLKKNEAVLMRRTLTNRSGEPSELVTSYFPLSIAHGTDLDGDRPIEGGTRQHVEARHKVRYDHMTEQIAARLPSLDEAKLLEIASKLTPVLALTVTAYDTAGHPIQVSHLVLPGDRHELEDTYSLI
jgi:GntR family transcriptional regulator